MRLQFVLRGILLLSFFLSVYRLSSLFLTLSLRSSNAVLCLALRRGMSEQRDGFPFVMCSLVSAAQGRQTLQKKRKLKY